MKHKHADVIHAWADGAQVQVEVEMPDGRYWRGVDNPTWLPRAKYRVKPTTFMVDGFAFDTWVGQDILAITPSGASRVRFGRITSVDAIDGGVYHAEYNEIIIRALLDDDSVWYVTTRELREPRMSCMRTVLFPPTHQ